MIKSQVSSLIEDAELQVRDLLVAMQNTIPLHLVEKEAISAGPYLLQV